LKEEKPIRNREFGCSKQTLYNGWYKSLIFIFLEIKKCRYWKKKWTFTLE